MGDVPRAGNDSGGGQLGNAIHCKPHGRTTGSTSWCRRRWDARHQDRRRAVCERSAVRQIAERRKNQNEVWKKLNKFAANYTKRELMAILNDLDVPCGPIMGTADLANDEHVRGRDMWVELDHPQRGKWFNVGMPIKLSASPPRIKRSPRSVSTPTRYCRKCSATTRRRSRR